MSVIINNGGVIINKRTIVNKGLPNVVKDGLVFYVDAGLPLSYVRGSSTIYDISGNNYTGTLYNGATYDSDAGGNLAFDGVNDYCSTTYIQPAYSADTSFTWDVWCYARTNTANPVIGNRFSSFSPLNFAKLQQVSWQYYPSIPGNIGNGDIFAMMPLNTWINVCIVKNGSTFSYYRNNSLMGTKVSTGYMLNTNPFFIGGDNLAGEYSNSKIATVRVYNKALNTTERLQNYNELKNRFGL